jgi:peroxiredoxin
MTQLVELRDRIPEFDAAGIKVYGVSYDPQAALKRFSDKYSIAYDLLSDAGSVVVRQFGILNTAIDPDDPRAGPYYGIPFPGTYVVDESGVVTEKFFNRHYASRASAGTILDKTLGRVLVPEEAPQADHAGERVKIAAFLSDRNLKLETVSTLHVRLELADGLHVYAEPLPDGFYATTVTVEPSPELRIGEPVYPPTGPQRFEALGVTLNVYEGVVNIAVPITVTAEWERVANLRRRAGFSVRETVDFQVVVKHQVCSATVCYRPETERLRVRAPLAELVIPVFEP